MQGLSTATATATATAGGDFRAAGRSLPAHRFRARTTIAAGVAAAVVIVGWIHGSARPARGEGDDPPAGLPDHRAALVAEVQRTLKTDDVRLIALASQILDDPAAPGGSEDQLERLRIEAIRAEGEYQYATQRREIAEMVFKEYTEATLPQELAAVNSELGIAQTAMVAAREQAKEAKDDVRKIVCQLEVQKAAFGLELAESKKKVLVKYTRDQRSKDLQSQVARARSDERARKAEWERLKRRLETMEAAAKAGPSRTDVENRILGLLDRAAPIEERIQAGLQRLKKEQTPDDAAATEIRKMVDDLGALIDEAEAVKAAADFARVRPRIQRTTQK